MEYDILDTDYGLIKIHKNDTFIRNDLKKFKSWEPHLRRYFDTHLREGDVAVDIGAFIGIHTITMSKCVGETGKVLSFEPVKKTFQLLKENIIYSRCHNILAFNLGVGEKNGEKYYSECDQNKFVNWGAITLTDEDGDNKIKTRVISLDELEISRLDLINIDCEWMEMEVLNGMYKTIMRTRPQIVIEIHQKDIGNVNKYFIDVLDYKLVGRFQETNHDILSFDFLYLPKELDVKIVDT
jgi:FkbM family methyltransferase